MKKFLFFALLTFMFNSCFAQSTAKIINQQSVSFVATYDGGDTALQNFISENLKYPQDAKDNKIEGNVIIEFIVDKDGSIRNIQFIKGVCKSIDLEAKRLVKMFPNFIPAKDCNDTPISTLCQCEIQFKLK